MKNLMIKEWRLAMHPAAVLFLGLSALLMIPNYPYYVTFFYTCLGIFFICLTGRENQDILYMMLLPVRKRDIVRARISTAVTLQVLQAVIAIPFMILRGGFSVPNNAVGMEANIALLGLSFVMMGIFNFVFFVQYYHDPDQIGKPFVLGSVLMFVYMGVMEMLTHIVPFFRDRLDTRDPAFLGEKLCVLLAGLLIYSLLTLIACKKSEKEFELLDL